MARLGRGGGTLDHVTAWFIKAGEYVGTGRARIGFVATNSVTQGEQVAQLWPILFQRCGLEIAFAHRTFAWGSDARGAAHVHVVILGLDRREDARRKKRLFSYPDIKGEPEESVHAVLSPYLFDAGGLADPHLTVREESRPINGMRRLIIGSKPIDGGNYIFGSEQQRSEFVATEPNGGLHTYVTRLPSPKCQSNPIVTICQGRDGSPATIPAIWGGRAPKMRNMPRAKLGRAIRYGRQCLSGTAS